MTRLQRLFLGNTGVTDAGLHHLTGFSRLIYLDLSNNPKVTDAGVKKLNAALPRCTVYR